MQELIAPTTSVPLHPTMGQGVAERTYLRRLLTGTQQSVLQSPLPLNPKDPDFRKWYVAALNSSWPVVIDDEAQLLAGPPDTVWEKWHEVADRVARGNVSLLGGTALESGIVSEYRLLADAIANGSVLMSGRHLQQGDAGQSSRTMEVFSNCATAPTSFALFTLQLSGAGVGRDYSDKMMAVDWASHMPAVIPVLAESHPDFRWGAHVSAREAKHLYGTGKKVRWHRVADSREGWGKAVETLETITYENGYGRRPPNSCDRGWRRL